MKRILRKLKKIFNPGSHASELSLEQKIELGLLPWFHGNNKVKDITVGKHSYVSYNSIIYCTDIGNYCSIGPNVVIGYGDHPIDYLSTSPHIYYNSQIFNQSEIDKGFIDNYRRVKIESDVWIGANAFVKNGVRIGIGAVIGAGAVVVNDVGDYEIVVGIPAKPLRKRFSDDLIKLLMESKWWSYEPNELVLFEKAIKNPTIDNMTVLIKELKRKKIV